MDGDENGNTGGNNQNSSNQAGGGNNSSSSNNTGGITPEMLKKIQATMDSQAEAVKKGEKLYTDAMRDNAKLKKENDELKAGKKGSNDDSGQEVDLEVYASEVKKQTLQGIQPEIDNLKQVNNTLIQRAYYFDVTAKIKAEANKIGIKGADVVADVILARNKGRIEYNHVNGEVKIVNEKGAPDVGPTGSVKVLTDLVKEFVEANPDFGPTTGKPGAGSAAARSSPSHTVESVQRSSPAEFEQIKQDLIQRG